MNEQLDDIYRAACVPYLATLNLEPCRCQDSLTILDELLGARSPEPTHHAPPTAQDAD